MTKEKVIQVTSGWSMLGLNLGLVFGGVLLSILCLIAAANTEGAPGLGLLVTIPLSVAGVIMLFGHFTLQPNEARVLTLFGTYVGTVRESGFFWTNPFMTKIEGFAPHQEPGKSAAESKRQARQPN